MGHPSFMGHLHDLPKTEDPRPPLQEAGGGGMPSLGILKFVRLPE
jgi:hypothetical protein